MKAVVWTDAIQMVILLLGLLVVAVLGSAKVGGGAEVWRIAQETGRVNFNSFSVDPRVRHTFWTQSLGTGVTFMARYVSNQMVVQRYMSVATEGQAVATLYISLLVYLPVTMFVVYIGLVVHATYSYCDPLLDGRIKTGDQIMPFFMIDLLGEYAGVPGLLTASVFAAALSSVSSVINSLAAVCLEDFISPAVKCLKRRSLQEQEKKCLVVGIVVVSGMMTVALSFVASHMTSKIIQASGTIWGVLGGPLAGIFVMGFFMPFCNSAGAIGGMLGGLAVTLWISAGGILYKSPPLALPIGSCTGNVTLIIRQRKYKHTSPLVGLYEVSYAWYGVIGLVTSITIGVLVSLATHHVERCRPSISRNLMNLCCCESQVFGETQSQHDSDTAKIGDETHEMQRA